MNDKLRTVSEIIEELRVRHAEFGQLLESLSEAEYLEVPLGKWSAGQQLDHICRCVAPVNMAFGLPAFLLRLIFGKANRPSCSYDALVQKYHEKLAAGGRAGGRYIPGEARWSGRAQLLKDLARSINSLSEKVGKVNDNQLDTLIVPHPILGKLTLREMLYFTIYHVQHHQRLTLQNLGKLN